MKWMEFLDGAFPRVVGHLPLRDVNVRFQADLLHARDRLREERLGPIAEKTIREKFAINMRHEETLSDGRVRCKRCNVTCNTLYDRAVHHENPEHQKLCAAAPEMWVEAVLESDPDMKMIDQNTVTCMACGGEKRLQCRESYDAHVASENHKDKVRKYGQKRDKTTFRNNRSRSTVSCSVSECTDPSSRRRTTRTDAHPPATPSRQSTASRSRSRSPPLRRSPPRNSEYDRRYKGRSRRYRSRTPQPRRHGTVTLTPRPGATRTPTSSSRSGSGSRTPRRTATMSNSRNRPRSSTNDERLRVTRRKLGIGDRNGSFSPERPRPAARVPIN